MRFVKVRFSLLALALVGALVSVPGCGGGGAHAPLRVELAPTLDCTEESAAFPDDLRFFTLQICPSDHAMPCVMLTDPSGDHGGGTTLLRVARTLDRRFTVDARVDGGTDYDVTVTGYSGAETGTCTPYALGHARGVRFGGASPVSVRLYPLGGWSCAGAHEGSTASVPRALHQAVLLPDGTVLLLGGIAGSRTSPMVPAVAFGGKAVAQRTVEVFDPRDARFHAVSFTDEDGLDGFSRVLFQARYVSTNADGMYEIHTYGGFDIDNAPEGGIGFDGNANVTAISALYGPVSQMMMGAAAGFRADAVILYDPTTRTGTAAAHGTSTYTTTAATDGAAPFAVVRSIDSVTVNMATGRPSYGLSAGAYVDGGREAVLMNDRFGASITPISATNFLVWGGNVATAMDGALADPVPTAGEIVNSMAMGTTAVAAHDSTVSPDDNLPFATAYHTATRIAGRTGSSAILFVGGAVLGAGPTPLGTTTFATPSLTVTRFASDGTVAGGERITGRISTVLHTATPVDTSMTDILVVGGASQMPLGGVTTTLFGVQDTGLVTFAPSTSTYSWTALPDLVSGRWGHTTTIIPNHGVLVVGGLSRTDANVTVMDDPELLLWEDLRNMGRPTSMDCAMATDAGMSMDGGVRTDTGPARDTGPAVDTGARPDTGPDVGADT